MSPCDFITTSHYLRQTLNLPFSLANNGPVFIIKPFEMQAIGTWEENGFIE